MVAKPKRPLLEADVNSKFARALGSTDYATREAGLQAVQHWLASRPELEALECLKLWRAIFYAFWHSDKHHVQVGAAMRAAMPACMPCC